MVFVCKNIRISALYKENRFYFENYWVQHFRNKFFVINQSVGETQWTCRDSWHFILVQQVGDDSDSTARVLHVGMFGFAAFGIEPSCSVLHFNFRVVSCAWFTFSVLVGRLRLDLLVFVIVSFFTSSSSQRNFTLLERAFFHALKRVSINCFQGNVIAMLRALGILMLRHLRRVSISNRESILLAQIFCTTGFFGLHIGTSGLEKKIPIIGVSFIYASLKTLRFTV